MKYFLSTTLAFVTFVIAGCGGGGDAKSPSVSAPPTPVDDAVIYASCGNVPNYVTAVQAHRWKRFPLTVGIDWAGAPTGDRATQVRAIQAGALAWTVAGNGIGTVNFIGFEEVGIYDIGRAAAVANAADILIKFDNSLVGKFGETTLRVARSPSGLGFDYKGTTIRINGKLISQSVITAEQFAARLQVVAAHETGHAMFAGFGHAPAGTDVMAVDGPTYIPSQTDVNTIREAYCRR